MNSENIFYQLSESQKSIWYLEKAHPGTSLNTVAGSVRLKGDINYKALEKAINIFVKRNDAMRLRIKETDGVAMQYVTEYREFKLEFFDFSKGSGLKDLFEWDEENTRKPFDIIDGPLFYCALFKVSDDEGGSYMKMHHLISDAWTMGLGSRQIIELYSQINNGFYVDETPNPSYLDHLRSNAEYEKSARFESDRLYWNNKFETIPEMTVLKTPKSSEISIKAKRKTLITPLKLSNKIREFSKANRLSVFTLFMSALSIYINRVTGIEDIVLGTTILNRTSQKDKETLGMFVSVAAPVRISVSDAMDFKTFAGVMLKENTDVLRHQKYPYNYLLRDLKKKHKLSNRLFDIVLSYQNSKLHKEETDVEYAAKWLFSGYQIESLVISINDRDDGGNLIIDYDFLTDVFDVREIEFLHQHVISLLWHALDNPAKSISRLEMISEKEKQTILRDFNDTYADYPRDKTLHQVFEEQALRTPENTALIFNDRRLTYAELNERSNRLAHTLRQKGVGPDKIVGLMTYRSVEMLVGIMGILKAGGAYMPIDPDYPGERKNFMLRNSCTGILLAQHGLLDSAEFGGLKIDLEDESSYSEDATNPARINSPKDLAYVIYTSGSTGSPKGVMVEHTGVVNRIHWMLGRYPLNQDSVILQKTTYSFDVSVWELFSWSFIGAAVCLANPGDEKDPEAMIRAVEKHGITAMHFVPSMLTAFLYYVENKNCAGRLQSLVNVFTSGEALTIHQAQTFNRLLYETNGTQLSNLYGPTEATVEVSYFECTPMPALSTVPIGRPIDNISLYIFDKNMNLLPVGIPGELYIGGVGVARGYLFNPDLTAQKFVVNPYKRNEILYRTGDRVRWFPKGDIEFLGRMDYQVKIKGFRIELGEIETRLLSHPSVAEAVVKPYNDQHGQTYLAAYIVASGIIGADDIRGYLAETLPEYMVPGCFVFMDAMPLNSNGKADRGALPEPGAVSPASAEFEPPADETEAVLSEIWRRVLGLDRVGVLDDYAALGGDSLSAIKIITDIHKAFGVELSPKSIFSLKTIRRTAAQIAAPNVQKNAYTEISKTSANPCYELSAAQKRQYILHKIDGGVSYNLPGGMEIEGEIDAGRVSDVFKTIIRRHESLRTSFELWDGEPVQVIHEDFRFAVEYAESAESDCRRLMEDFVRPFDLTDAPLLRVKLVKVKNGRHVLLIDMHHIISDGASVNIIMKEFLELYSGGELPALKTQYKDYAAWHNGLLKSEKIKPQEKYWLDKLSGEIPALNMPLDFPRPAYQSFKGSRLHFVIGETLTAGLRQLTKKTGATLFMLLLASYNVLLSKYSGQDDIIVGTPVEGRLHGGLRSLVGMFVNTLAIRSNPAADKPFEAFLAEVREDLLNAYDNQEYPFEELVEKVGVRRDMSRNPIFDTTFVLQNTDLSAQTAGDFTAVPFAYDDRTAKFDLTLEATDKGGTIACCIEYATDLFKDETIQRLSSHYMGVLGEIVRDPSMKLGDISILSEAERHRLLRELNDTDADYPREKTIHQIFEEQAEKTPDSVALVFGDETMTYRALNEKANRLARTLRAKGIGPDDVVGLLVDRSFEMIVSILGVLKAGGAYMPIDPEYPEERITYMLENSGAKLLLTKSKYTVPDSRPVLYLDDSAAYAQDASNPAPVNNPSDLAYIIYTSGSTGRPKGVMIEHRNVVGLICNTRFPYRFDGTDTWTLFNSYCFDFTVWKIYGALLHGCALVIIPLEAMQNMALLYAIVKSRNVTVLNITPQSLYEFVRYEQETGENALNLRYVFYGGEPSNALLLLPLKYRYPSARFVNFYGPTECTVLTAVKTFELHDFISNINNIGSAVPMAKTYVLDGNRKLVPTGITGELYVSGNCLGRGYINNVPLTRERFVENPFEENSLMYKTGDIVRRLPAGDLEYLGRTDNQVKIRGFRIELGEIENALKKHPQIAEAVVTVFEPDAGSKKLSAFFKAGTRLSAEELSAFLSAGLPDYMIPSFFIQLDEFPTNTSGKIDRNRLPRPTESLSGDGAAPPRNSTDLELARIWGSVLGIKSIGITDNFFFVGGDSLSAVKVAAFVGKSLGVEISPRDIFRYRTIGALSDYIDSQTRMKHLPIPRVDTAAYYPVSSAQRRQYILNKIDGGISYNVPGGLVLSAGVEADHIEKVLRRLIERHASLRTRFEIRNGEPVQMIDDTVAFSLERVSSEENEPDALIKSFVRPFDLAAAPLFRARLISISEDKRLLLFDMHHIISDGASMKIILREFSELFCGKELPELAVQYNDYAAWHNELLKSEKVKGQEAFWLDRFAGEIPVLNLPLDYPRPSIQSVRGETQSFSLESELAAGVRRLAVESGATLFMVLFSAYSVLLSKYTGQEDLVVGSPVEGRRHADLQDIVGMFVNTLAIRTYPTGEKTFASYLEEVREDLLNAYENQDYPFEALVDKLGVKRDIGRNPLFDTMFVLQNAEWQKLQIGGSEADICRPDSQTAKFDLTFEAVDHGDSIEIRIEYCTDLFRQETIRRLFSHFATALNDIVEHPAKELRDITILSDAERRQLLCEFNDTDADYPREKTIHQIFEEQAEKTPDSVALVFGDETMTYRALNEKANRLARTLRAKGIGPDDVVGLLVDRSFEMIVSILGVLKAGGAYMPIDPEYPEERITYMLENSGAKLLLTKSKYTVPDSRPILYLDDSAAYAQDASNPAPVNNPSDLAYIIYTSGSTGRPKGVMIEHRNVVGLICNTRFPYRFDGTDTWTLFNSYCFDFTVWKIYGALLHGCALVIIPLEAMQNMALLYAIVKSRNVTVLNITPQSLYEFVRYEQETGENALNLRYVFYGGEPSNALLLLPLKKKYPSTQFANLYGPTECTVLTAVKTFDLPDFMDNINNIGTTVPMAKTYVLDKDRQLVPLGICGELYVSGNCVGRGYVNNMTLTQERFIGNPFEGNNIMYKTGDIVRRLPNGDLEYIGRADSQVKIRGFRIELGEIESMLLQHEAVEEAIVVTRETNTGNKLCAYFKPNNNLTAKELAQFLKCKMPDYMIPTYMVQVDRFPLNKNGKIDRMELPEPDEAFNSTVGSVAPRDLTEELIAVAWANVLDLPTIGIDDNFFELGGDSLNAVQVVSMLKLGINIVDFYTNPTIRQLAELLSKGKRKAGLLINMSKNFHHANSNVICFPYGGGSALSYRDVSNAIKKKSAKLNIYSVNLPGHDYGTHDELQPINDVAHKLADEIAQTLTGEIILYGHCAGSAPLIATAQELIKLGVKIKAVFIGGILAPRFVKLYGWLYRLFGAYFDKHVLRYLRKFGVSDDILADEEFVHYMSKAFRYDKQSYTKFFYSLASEKSSRLNCPLHLVVGENDASTKRYKKRSDDWKRYFSGVDTIVIEDADHYFIHTHPDILTDHLLKVV